MEHVLPTIDHPGLHDPNQWGFMESVGVTADYRF